MSRWFRMYDEVLDDPKVQRLQPVLFKAEFLAAAAGKPSAFGDLVRPGSGRPPIAEWRLIRREVFARDDYRCVYCGERGVRLECDHVVPVSRGGSSDPSNLATACRDCNQSKGAKTPEEWGGADHAVV